MPIIKVLIILIVHKDEISKFSIISQYLTFFRSGNEVENCVRYKEVKTKFEHLMTAP